MPEDDRMITELDLQKLSRCVQSRLSFQASCCVSRDVLLEDARTFGEVSARSRNENNATIALRAEATARTLALMTHPVRDT